ncbi:MAG: TSUP family transporter, partial [Nocardioides sp.]|nr:TSUP family transporter [Nocardioides sp.]
VLTAGIAVAMLVMVALVASGLRIPARALPVAGLASGALLTSTGMNGPPLVMALSRLEPLRYRATLQAVFAGQDVVAVASFVVLGLWSRESALLAVAGVAGLPLGWRLGDAIFRRVPAHRLRHVVVAGLVVTGLSVLFSAL